MWKGLKNWWSKQNGVNMVALIFMVIGWFVIPWALNMVMINARFATHPGLTTSDWLTFWGGYLGSSLTAMIAAAAILVSYGQNRKQHQQTRHLMEEQQRRDVQPFLLVEERVPPTAFNRGYYLFDYKWLEGPTAEITQLPRNGEVINYLDADILTLSDVAKLCSSRDLYCFRLENVGTGALWDLELHADYLRLSLQALAIKQPIYLFVRAADDAQCEQLLYLDFQFRDINGRCYTQHFQFGIHSETGELLVHLYHPILLDTLTPQP